MTIALGIISDEAIVVAADTEESIPGYFKRDEQKIQLVLQRHTPPYPIRVGMLPSAQVFVTAHKVDDPPFEPAPDTDIALSGAGTAGYIDALMPRLVDVFRDNIRLTDDEGLRAKTEAVVRRFYREHVIPFAGYPPGERPEVEMLVAYHRANTKRILVSEKTAVRIIRQGHVAAVGAGAFFAKTLLDRFSVSGGLDVRTAQLLAIYAVFRVKEFIDGCGKHTMLALVPDTANTQLLKAEQIIAIEEVFRKHSQVDVATLSYVFRHPNAGPKNAEALAEKFQHLRSACDGVLAAPSNPAAQATE